MTAATTTTDDFEEEAPLSKWESVHLKTLAEQSYTNKDLESALKYTKKAHRLNPSLNNLSDMLTAYNILVTASATSKPNWYKILNLEPFCHIDLIKQSYKKLALSLHPDKNTFVGSEDAFKLVNDAFTVLKDKVKRNEYDTQLRMDMQADVEGGGGDDEVAVETFWTACSVCKLLHQFERKYIGFSLMCPNCKKSFKAVEFVEGTKTDVVNVEDEDEDSDDMVLKDYKSKRKTSSVVNVEDEDSDDMVLNDIKSKRKTSSLGNIMKDVDDEESDDMVLNDYKSKRKTSRVSNTMRNADDEDSNDMVLNNYKSKRKTSSVSNTMRYADDEDIDDMVLNNYKSKRKTSNVRNIMRYADDEDSNDMVLNDYKSKRKTSTVGNIMRYADDEDSDDMVLNDYNSKRKTSSVGDIMKRSEQLSKSAGSGNGGVRRVSKRTRVAKRKDDEEVMTLAEMRKFAEIMDEDEDEVVRSKSGGVSRRERVVRNKQDEEMLTLAEMKKLAELNVDDDDEEEGEEMLTLAELKSVKTNVNDGKLKVRFKVNEKNKVHEADGDVKNLEIMTVEDSDFYDFDTGRVEKSFKKGQVWALYDDDDGMPRHYGLIEEVVSRHPFEVKMAWLDPQKNGDEGLISLENTGFNISCGRFKVSKKTLVQSLNVFSHVVDCERAAREVYRIYPKKGSVWALYSENGLVGDKRSFDLVVFLTSYSEVHGLSMGYLEKVDGFKTIFKRREIGCHAIKWLEKHEVKLFSHQIPARKVSREEVPHISGDCWELDPASLSTELLTNGLLE